MTTDEELVAASLAGDDTAFPVLVTRYRDRLLRFLLTRSAHLADAEDVVQDTLISAYRYLHSYDPRWQFSTWIYRIAIRNAATTPPPALEGAEAVSDDDPLLQCVADNERDNLWVVAKQVLSPDAHTALWLHYAEDMPVKDVAVALQRSVSWVKVNLFRSRRQLAAAMRSQTPESKEALYG